jgi:hypothetical protein
MKIIYLDTSAINHLHDDPNASTLTEAIKTKTQPLISVFTFMEIASTSDSHRRLGLLTSLKGIAGKYRPAGMPGDLLRRSLEAISVLASRIEISMGPEYDGVWIALKEPKLIDDDAYKEIMERKRHEEEWYQDMHDQGRPEIQQALAKFPPRERDTLTFSRFMKHYRSSTELVNIVYNLALRSGASVKVDNELVLRTIQCSEHWRFFLAGMAHGLYARSARIRNFSKNKNPGSVDTQQSIYLATCDVFVTADQQQYRMLRLLVPFGHKKREVWKYSNFVSWLLRIREGC